METQKIETEKGAYVECSPAGQVRGEEEALELVAACMEWGTFNLLLHGSSLPEEFFHLRSGLAGKILLKFSNYGVKAALILEPGQVREGKFTDWVLETNRGREFRVFFDRPAAETWLAAI